MATTIPPSAVKMTPLQLNGIKLDVRHTVLTPDYLEKLVAAQTAETANATSQAVTPPPSNPS